MTMSDLLRGARLSDPTDRLMLADEYESSGDVETARLLRDLTLPVKRGDDRPIEIRLDAFTTAYLVCALWSSTDDNDIPLDANHDINDIAPESIESAARDCARFQRENADDLAEFANDRAGHDFWLTRNHHGAGYWDGDYPDDIGERLTEASHQYGEVDAYIGDDGRIYLSK